MTRTSDKKLPPMPILWRNRVTDHPDVTSVEWAVAMALSMHMDNKTGKCWPGFATIGRTAHIGRTSVAVGLNGLVEKGLLHRQNRRKVSADGTRVNDTNVYTALLPKPQGGLDSEATYPRPQGDPTLVRRAASISSEISPGSAPEGQPRDEVDGCAWHAAYEETCADCRELWGVESSPDLPSTTTPEVAV